MSYRHLPKTYPRKPRRPPGTTAGPAGSATAVRWLIQGAWGTPWHAGTGPGAMHRWTTVALPPQRLGRVGEREPSVPLRALREALGLPDPCHPVRPPRCARPRPRAQAVQRGGPGEGTRALGACRQDAHGRVIRRPARLPGRLACHTSRRVPPPLARAAASRVPPPRACERSPCHAGGCGGGVVCAPLGPPPAATPRSGPGPGGVPAGTAPPGGGRDAAPAPRGARPRPAPVAAPRASAGPRPPPPRGWRERPGPRAAWPAGRHRALSPTPRRAPGAGYPVERPSAPAPPRRRGDPQGAAPPPRPLRRREPPAARPSASTQRSHAPPGRPASQTAGRRRWCPARRQGAGDRTGPTVARRAGRPGPLPAPGPILGPGALGCQEGWGVQKVCPVQGPGVLVQPPQPPLGDRLVPPRALPGPPVDEAGLGFWATSAPRPGRGGMAPPRMPARRTGPAPAPGSAQRPRAALRQWPLRLTGPKPGLPGTAQRTTRLADAGAGGLPWPGGALGKALVPRAHTPDGDCPQDLPPGDGGFTGVPGALPQAAPRLCRQRALPPPDEPLMELPRLLEALSVAAPGLRPGTAIDEMRPGAVVARQPGGFPGADRPALPTRPPAIGPSLDARGVPSHAGLRRHRSRCPGPTPARGPARRGPRAAAGSRAGRGRDGPSTGGQRRRHPVGDGSGASWGSC